VLAEVAAAFNSKDSVAFGRAAEQFLRLHDQTEALLNGHPYYRLETYKRQALRAGNTQEERRNNLANALMLVTYWGENNRKEDNLHEYAYKEWAGMMVPFYKRRWEMYFDHLRGQLRGEQGEAPDFFGWEREWVSRQEKSSLSGL